MKKSVKEWQVAFSEEVLKKMDALPDDFYEELAMAIKDIKARGADTGKIENALKRDKDNLIE